MANQLYTENGEELYNSKGELLMDNDPEAIEHVDKPEYSYEKPEDYELLKRNVAEVGYSGLDDTQKELFKSQFPKSKFALAGGSFEDATKYVDESAGVNPANQNAGSAYTLGRNILTTGFAPYVAGLEYAKDRLFNEGGWAADEKPYTEYLSENLEAGNKGEGVTGFLGNPTNLMGGVGNVLKGAPVVGSPLVRGAIEGAGISAVDQYNQGGSIDPKAMAYSGLAGGIFGSVSDKVASKADEYSEYLAKQKLATEDPLAYIMGSHPEVDKALALKMKARSKIDPNGLYDDYSRAQRINVRTGEITLFPGAEKELIKSAKKSIADNSLLPRKMSTITDREAREHLDRIVKEVEDVPNPSIDIDPKNPLAETHLPMNTMLGGGIAGHYLGGPVGAAIGTFLGTRTGQAIVDKTLSKGINAGARVAVSPVGKLAGGVPYTPLAAGISDKLINPKKDTTSEK